MTKVFISLPMAGKTYEEIEAERDAVYEDLNTLFPQGYTVIDSVTKDYPGDAKPLWFLGEAIKKMSTADVVYFASDWDKARGCKIEHDCAVAYGIGIIETL